MKQPFTYEDYQDVYLNVLLDKINKSGINSLSENEKDYLDAYSKGDKDTMADIVYEEGQREFKSNDGHFKFLLDRCEDHEDEFRYCGIITVPDLKWPDGKTITGEIEGNIIVYQNGEIVADFEKDGYDILEFCNGLEYELDSFLDYIICTLEDEKRIK